MSDKNLQLCRFCQREIKFLYYCEDCGIACCSDCLRDDFHHHYVCQDCNSKDIEHNEAEGKRVCKECGSENVIKITQHLKACPKCHSLKILNIYEKKEELEQEFLELIKLSRAFIQPLRDVINELYLIRHSIKKARDPPIRCYHYPKMESELLALFMAVIHLIDGLQNKINSHFRHLAINKEYFFDIYNQPNSNIRIIESILDNLSSSHHEIETYIKTTTEEIYDKFEPFKNNLQFIEKVTKLFFPYTRFLRLAEDEKPVYAVRTTLTNGLDPQKKSKKSKGFLFITSFDLSFVHEYGMFKKKRELIFKAPIDDLIDIQDKGKFFKKLFIKFDYGKYEFSLPSNFIQRIIEYILLARSFQDNAAHDQEATKKLQETDLDLTNLIKFIEEGINSFFNLKCQYNKNGNIAQKKVDQRETPYDKSYVPNRAFQSVQQGYIGAQNNYAHYNNQYQPHVWPQKDMGNYYHESQNPNKSVFYGDINRGPHMRTSQFNRPEEYNYYDRNLRQQFPPDFNRNNFYSQNIYHPYRYQNYEPQTFYKPYYNQPFDNPEYSPNSADLDERNILMKKLEKEQRINSHFRPNSSNMRENLFDGPDFFERYDPMFSKNLAGKQINRDHLSKSFQSNYHSQDGMYNQRNGSFQFDEDINDKMENLKRERYSLKKTLKELEAKFERGSISEVEYFKAYKNYQKEIFSIDQKIKLMTEKVNDELFLKRNFDQKKYFS